jgi:hypothetical protein
MHLEPWIVVGGRGPLRARPRLEVPATPGAVALGHLAVQIEKLAMLRKLQENSANAKPLELLDDRFSGGR